MIFGKRAQPEQGLESPAQAAARAEQLSAGVTHAATALRSQDAESADAALEAGTRLARAAAALAGALTRSSDGDARAQRDAEALLRSGVEVLHRLHFEIIRVSIQEADAGTLPLEEAARVTAEIEETARRLGDRGSAGGAGGAGGGGGGDAP